eukprot:TRINITY_DN9224_c0_g1_i2.p1 TRINITY_DN9224_c0_g1~~TRINITY_DN9224_c0_g1_i2.p1  ORF type:complete len:423 (+),score=38.23 TRINITY_DN9224_c0_g1_i2:29-1270(+)
MLKILLSCMILICAVNCDLVCKTTGSLGCNLSCSLYGRGSGKCSDLEQECICSTEEKRQEPEEIEEIDLDWDFSDSFWSDEDDIENDQALVDTTDEKISEDLVTSDTNDEEYLPWLLRKLIFFPVERKGFFGFLRDIGDPTTFALNNAINLRIPSENGSLGAWFIAPSEKNKPIESLNGTDKLVVYMHGSSATRGYSYRVRLYRKLVSMGYYVLAFDYRGYADSSPVKLSETSVVTDALAVLTWLNSTISAKERPLMIVWGHSLGTAIASNAIHQWETSKSGLQVDGLVLESPFNTMHDEILRFSLGRFFANTLGKNTTQILMAADAEFRSADRLPKIKVPTLILHADNDRIVPSYLGERLYKAAKEGGKKNVKFILFPSDLNLGHRHIYSAPGLSLIVEDFEKEVIQFKETN